MQIALAFCWGFPAQPSRQSRRLRTAPSKQTDLRIVPRCPSADIGRRDPLAARAPGHYACCRWTRRSTMFRRCDLCRFTEAVCVELLVETHAADAQLGGSPPPIVAVPDQRILDLPDLCLFPALR